MQRCIFACRPSNSVVGSPLSFFLSNLITDMKESLDSTCFCRWHLDLIQPWHLQCQGIFEFVSSTAWSSQVAQGGFKYSNPLGKEKFIDSLIFEVIGKFTSENLVKLKCSTTLFNEPYFILNETGHMASKAGTDIDNVIKCHGCPGTCDAGLQ
jgi:hypothetical protein